MDNIGFIIYIVGAFVSGICVCVDAYRSNKNHENIEQFTAVLSVFSLISWLGVALYLYRYFKFRNTKTVK